MTKFFNEKTKIVDTDGPFSAHFLNFFGDIKERNYSVYFEYFKYSTILQGIFISRIISTYQNEWTFDLEQITHDLLEKKHASKIL